MLTILKASAGSGKTYSLTYEYIKLLLGYKDSDGRYRLNRRNRDRHRHILAITFTNKATDEMKQRIVHELALLAGREPGWNSESPYAGDLVKEFGCTPEELTKAADKALHQLLFDFSYFHVSTIDAFFQTILRTFAREAELDGNYELDLDTVGAIGYGVAELFSSMSSEPDSEEAKSMVKWISRYMLEQLGKGSAVTLFNRDSRGYEQLLRLISGLSDEKFVEHYDDMMSYLESDKLRVFRKGIRREMDALMEEVRRACLGALEALRSSGLPGDAVKKNLLTQIKDCSETGYDDKRVSAASVVKGGEFYNSSARALFEGGAQAQVYNAVMDACRAIVHNSSALTVLRQIDSNVFVMGLLRGVYSRVERYRSDNNTLLLSDTNGLLRKIIGDDDAPFIYERVGVDFKHFLIDEFQDTSRLQWENLRPLVNESQSWGHDNLIIGDEKQCIYRFRSSDPTLLQSRVRKEVRQDVMERGSKPSENTNWRSSRTMVEFNNMLFGSISTVYGYTDIYANVVQNVSKKHSGHTGYVDLWRSSDSKTFDEEALRRMTDGIKRQIAAGYSPCDIAVLTRFRAEAATVIDHLMEVFASDEELAPMGIRIISDDSMNIESSPAVKRVLSVLRSVGRGDTAQESDGEPEVKDSMMRSSAEFDNLRERYEFNIGRSMSPSESLSEAVDMCQEPLPPDKRLNGALCENLPAMVERIVHVYFPHGTVTEGEQVYLLAFEDVVTDFCATAPVADIQAFLRWWDATGHNARLASSSDTNAMRVMTIHKSKGLEFDCVHLPFVNWPMVRFKDLEWFEPNPVRGVPDTVLPPLVPMVPVAAMRNTPYREEYEKRHREQMLDELNALYVAFTRAKYELVVSMQVPKEKEVKRPKKGASQPGADEQAEAIRFSSPTAGQMVGLALRQLGYAEDTLVMGAPTEPIPSECEMAKAVTPLRTVPMPEYQVTLRDELMGKTRIETYADSELGRRHGNLLHDILSGIRTEADIDRAVGKALRCGALRHEEAPEVREIIREAIRNTADRGWFGGFHRILCERPIENVDSTGATLRPDRVVWTSDGHVDVIDYKFGRQKRKSYQKQVERYMDMFRKLGFDNVRGYVWYVELGEIEEC